MFAYESMSHLPRSIDSKLKHYQCIEGDICNKLDTLFEKKLKLIGHYNIALLYILLDL